MNVCCVCVYGYGCFAEQRCPRTITSKSPSEARPVFDLGKLSSRMCLNDYKVKNGYEEKRSHIRFDKTSLMKWG